MLKNASLLAISTLLACLTVEGGLRVRGYAPLALVPGSDRSWARPDPVLGWVNGAGRFASSEAGNADMNFDSAGRRATPAAPAGAPRVDIAGDSITQGYGVSDPETYVWRIAELRPGLAFANLGVGGFGTYQSLLVMEGRAADPPALYVYGFFGDHRFRNVAHLAWIRALRDSRGRNVVPPHVTPSGAGLARHAGRAVEPWPLETASALVTELHRAWMRLVFRARSGQADEALRRLLAAMRATAAAQRAGFLVLLLADAPEWLPAFLAAQGIAAADCRAPEFERDPALRAGGTGHPTGARHAAWAKCLAPALDEALAQRK
jgi:lysophospholipase L1-like esterase